MIVRNSAQIDVESADIFGTIQSECSTYLVGVPVNISTAYTPSLTDLSGWKDGEGEGAVEDLSKRDIGTVR
jgi:hypothetical protein